MFAVEYEIVGSTVSVNATLNKNERKICQLKPGTTFWGWPERGGIVEMPAFLSGFVFIKDRYGVQVVRPTNKSGKLLSEVRYNKSFNLWSLSSFEAYCFTCRSWRVQISTVIVRSEPSFEAKQVGIMKQETLFKVSEVKGDWLTIIQPFSGYLARRKNEVGILAFVDAVPDAEIEVTVLRPDNGRKIKDISIRTTSTISEMKARIAALIPVPETEICILVRVDDDTQFKAPLASTAWDIGLQNGNTLEWSYTGNESTLQELFDLELNINISIESDITGQAMTCPPLLCRADTQIGQLLDQLCDVSNWQRSALIPIKRKSNDRAIILDDSQSLWAAGLRDNRTMTIYYIDKIKKNNADYLERQEDTSTIESKRWSSNDIQSLEEMKQLGDQAFRSCNFTLAVSEYSKCLALYPSAMTVRNNRAAANKQLRDYDAIIFDTSIVLNTEPLNVKALLRRSEALEALEKYNDALKDINSLLNISDTIGCENATRCRSTQMRLRQEIEYQIQLQKMRAETKELVSTSNLKNQKTSKRKKISAAARREFEETRVITCASRSAKHETTLIWFSSFSDFEDVQREVSSLEKFVCNDNPELKLVVIASPTQRVLALDPEYNTWFDLSYNDWCSILEGSKNDSLTGYRCKLLEVQIERVANDHARTFVEQEVLAVGSQNVAIAGSDKGAVIALHVALSYLSLRNKREVFGAIIIVNGPSPLLSRVLEKISYLQKTAVWTLRGSHCTLIPTNIHDIFHSSLRHRLSNLSTEIIPTGFDEIITVDYAFVATVVSLTIGAFRYIEMREYRAIFEKRRKEFSLFQASSQHHINGRSNTNQVHSRHCRCVHCNCSGYTQ
uniref:Uncharacterized protein n=1 Tax=Aureoumbra lagunensis TaxID=44058 RepID=A0A7S3JY43_9STRA